MDQRDKYCRSHDEDRPKRYEDDRPKRYNDGRSKNYDDSKQKGSSDGRSSRYEEDKPRRYDDNRTREDDRPKRSFADNVKADSNKKPRDDKNYYGPGDDQWGVKEPEASKEDEAPVEKMKPNFGLSGALAKDEATGNAVNGVVLKFNIPFDAAIPDKKWRLYVFKDDKIIDTLHIHRKNSYLAGRDPRVADIEVAHPSCSKQHAVIHYRQVERKTSDGETYEKILPYLMDLGSVHKTFLNGKEIDDSRYYELRDKDCIKFGSSSREYVLMKEDTKEN